MSWSVVGESAVGTSHLARGIACQDAFRYQTLGTDGHLLAIVVADGAGSATCADRGATLTCDEIMRLLNASSIKAAPTCDDMRRVLFEARQRLVNEAASSGIAVRDLACTVLIAVVGPETSAFAQVGDGAIVYDADNEFVPIFWPPTGEYANSTEFLTDENAVSVAQLRQIDAPVSKVALFSDGLQRLALDLAGQSAEQGFFRPLFEALAACPSSESLLEPLREFLNSDRMNQRTDDDKTLVFGLRR